MSESAQTPEACQVNPLSDTGQGVCESKAPVVSQTAIRYSCDIITLNKNKQSEKSETFLRSCNSPYLTELLVHTRV